MTAVITRQIGLRDRFDSALEAFLDERIADQRLPGMDAALAHLRSYVLAGGKRVRPAFCYWGWRGAGGEDSNEIVKAAAALELLHVFALIHDDIMDGSDTRRGQPAMHRQLAALHASSSWSGSSDAFGVAGGILVGDLCMAWADELLHSSGLDEARIWAGRPVYSRMRTEMMAGQYLDMAETARGPSSVERSLLVVLYKAAKYTVESPLLLGGVLAGASPELLAAYSEFGVPLGEAFQLRDDVIGVFGDPAVTGKSVLDDLREGKPTVLMAYATEHATPAQRGRIRALHGEPELTEDGAAELRAIIRDTGALAAVEHMISTRTQQSLAALAAAPLTPDVRRPLHDLAVAATRRDA